MQTIDDIRTKIPSGGLPLVMLAIARFGDGSHPPPTSEYIAHFTTRYASTCLAKMYRRGCPSGCERTLDETIAVLVFGMDRETMLSEIRRVCAREFELPSSHRFFDSDYEPGESADAALLRIFCAEAAAMYSHGSLGANETHEDVIEVLCHG